MGFAARPGPRPALNAAVDDVIAEALKGPFRLRIDCQSRTDGAPVCRTIEPLGLLLGARISTSRTMPRGHSGLFITMLNLAKLFGGFHPKQRTVRGATRSILAKK